MIPGVPQYQEDALERVLRMVEEHRRYDFARRCISRLAPEASASAVHETAVMLLKRAAATEES